MTNCHKVRSGIILIVIFGLFSWMQNIMQLTPVTSSTENKPLSNGITLFSVLNSDIEKEINETTTRITNEIYWNDDILEELNSSQNNIFFVETNANLSKIPGRTICSFESVSLNNPKSNIYFFMDEKIKSQQSQLLDLQKVTEMGTERECYNGGTLSLQ